TTRCRRSHRVPTRSCPIIVTRTIRLRLRAVTLKALPQRPDFSLLYWVSPAPDVVASPRGVYQRRAGALALLCLSHCAALCRRRSSITLACVAAAAGGVRLCGANTRAGGACRMRGEFGKARCRLHGGLHDHKGRSIARRSSGGAANPLAPGARRADRGMPGV